METGCEQSKRNNGVKQKGQNMQNDIFDGNMLLYNLLSYFESESGNRCHRKKERSSYENQRRRSR